MFEDVYQVSIVAFDQNENVEGLKKDNRKEERIGCQIPLFIRDGRWLLTQ